MLYVKFTKLSLRSNADYSERWVQDRIAEDPSILGLGDVVLKDKERNQPRAGRLDILLQQADGNRRFEVEIQLGQTDESHIIRTIEEVLSKVVDGGNEKGGVPLVKSVGHQTCRQGKGVRHRESVYLGNPHRAIGPKP